MANLDSAEARTSPLPPDELERLGAPVTVEPSSVVLAPEQQAKLHRDELESQQKLWRWIIVLTLGVLLIETWLAGWTTRHPRTTERAAA